MQFQPNIDEVLSGFDAARPVGQGGMASIFMYENRLTGEQVAVKMLHSHVASDSGTIERFFHEVQASIRLDHRNIVNVLGYGDWQGKPAMVMEYIDGGDLKGLMERVERMPVEVAAHAAYQLFKGLDYSHRLGIVHRDIKPSNILISRDGALKITDFGISQVSDLTRLTRSGDVLGTPAYMSPEQASGKRLDERSDVFSAGVLLYEMLSNTNPFLAENPSVTLLNIIRCNVAPIFEFNPTVPYKMEVVLDRLLAKDPVDRIQSAAEAADLMEEIVREVRSEGFGVDDFAGFLKDPEGYISTSSAEDSIKHLERGKSLLTQDQEKPERAAVEFYRSLYLDPGNVEARQYLTSLTEKFSADGVLKPSEKLLELETAVKADPNNIAILLQLVKRARSEGDFIKAVAYSKRLARLRPKDVYILGQIETLLPNDQVTAVATGRRQSISTQGSASSMTTSEMTRDQTMDVPGGFSRDRSQQQPRPERMMSRPSPTVRKSGIGGNGLLLILLLGGSIIIGLWAANWFNRTSEQVGEEIPAAFEKLTAGLNQSGTNGSSSTTSTTLTGKARELIMKAQNAYKNGNRQGAIDAYRDFVSSFKNHPEADGVRIQLARLLVAEGDLQMAHKVLDEQIQYGRITKMTAFARLEKIRMYINTGNIEEARWECIYLEPNYRNLSSPDLQLEFLSRYASICKSKGLNRDAIRYYDTIIQNYHNKEKILEARMMKADILIDEGNNLDAQRELWVVRDQSRPDTLVHKNAVEKLNSLGLGDSGSNQQFQ